MTLVLEKIFNLVLDFCIVRSYNKDNKRTERQCRGVGVFNKSAVRFFWNILKGWLVFMLKSIFVSLVEAQVEAGCFGDLFFDTARNEENMPENKTIKQALNDGMIVQDNWSFFMLKLIYYVIQNDNVEEDSGEVLSLFHTISDYSYFISLNKEAADFHKRLFISRFLYWFSGSVKCVNYTAFYFQHKDFMTRAEWIIWKCLDTEPLTFRKKVQEIINENIDYAKHYELPCHMVFLTSPERQDGFFVADSYFEEVR